MGTTTPAGWERCSLCQRARPATELRTIAGQRVCQRCVPRRTGQSSLYERPGGDLGWLDELHPPAGGKGASN